MGWVTTHVEKGSKMKFTLQVKPRNTKESNEVRGAGMSHTTKCCPAGNEVLCETDPSRYLLVQRSTSKMLQVRLVYTLDLPFIQYWATCTNKNSLVIVYIRVRCALFLYQIPRIPELPH